jgi:hypothetical protein
MWLLTLRGNRARKSLFCQVVVGGSAVSVQSPLFAFCIGFPRAPSAFTFASAFTPAERRGRREGEGGRGGPFCRACAEVVIRAGRVSESKRGGPGLCRMATCGLAAFQQLPSVLVFQQPAWRSPVNWPQLYAAAHAAGRVRLLILDHFQDILPVSVNNTCVGYSVSLIRHFLIMVRLVLKELRHVEHFLSP